MMEPGARGEILSIAFSGKGQHQGCRCEIGSLCERHNRADHFKIDFKERRFEAAIAVLAKVSKRVLPIQNATSYVTR